MRYIVLLCSLILILGACKEDRFKEGKALYNFYCANCHMEDGSGLANLYPPLNNADYLEHNRLNLPGIIINGISDTIMVNGQTYDIPMEGYPELSAVQVSNIANYVLSAWDNELTPLSINEVKQWMIKKNINERY